MTSGPVICFALRGKEHVSHKNADSPGGRSSDESLTALSVGPAPLRLQDIDLGRMTLGICSLELHSVHVRVRD